MTGSRISRRRLLAVVGATGAFAGCSSTSDQESDGSPTELSPTESESPTTGSETSTPDSEPTRETEETDEESDEETTPEQPQETFYVSPAGSDGNPGTEESPMKTIMTALDAVGPGQTVYLKPGEYRGRVATIRSGEPGSPITITGSADAVIRPSKDVDDKYWNPILIQHSHYRLTGVTIDGLHTPSAPKQVDSYVKRLLKVSPRPETSEYITDVVVAPHGIGNSQTQLINVIRAKKCEFGPFKIIGPAGVEYLHGDKKSHQGEFLYLGSPLQTFADGADGYF